MRHPVLILILLCIAAVPTGAIEIDPFVARYITGDVLGNFAEPGSGFVVANVTVVENVGVLYSAYAVERNGTRWEIPLYYNHRDEFTESSIAAADLRRIDHVDPILVVITDPTVTGGDIQYTGLSLAEALAGVIYPVEPAPGEPGSGFPLYVAGDILNTTSVSGGGTLIGATFTSDGQLFYRTYAVVREGDRWVIESFDYNGFGLPEEVLISTGMRRIAHADPHTIQINDTISNTGDTTWYHLSFAEYLAGEGYGPDLWDTPPSTSDLPRYLPGDILGLDAPGSPEYVVARVQWTEGTYPVYTLYGVTETSGRWEIPDYVNGDTEIDALNVVNQRLRRLDHVDPHFVIVTDRDADTTETYHYGLSLGEILGGTPGYPFEGVLQPYKPLTIPGRVEAEDYALGGEGVAYHDTTPGNLGGAYRQDDVDIEVTAGEGTPNVGWIRDGEFLAYTVNVTRDGTYTLTARVASPNAGRQMVLLGNGVTETITVPNTGSFAKFATVTVPVTLVAGEQDLVLSFRGDGQNLDWFAFAPRTDTPEPFKPHTIPGTIEAEDYDLGGEGIAYHDTTPGNLGGAYRQDDVDIEKLAGLATPNVGWIRNGEYLTWTAEIGTAGSYTMTARVASPNSGRTAALQVDGTQAATISVPNTGSFATFRTVSVPATLPAGTHTLKLVFSGDGQNIDSIAFTTGSVTTPTPTPTPTPGAGGASFVAVPTTGPHGSPFKFTVTPAAGKSIGAAWWSFDAPAHLNTWNSRNVNPTFFYFVPGTYSPLVRLTYTDGTTEEVHRVNYIRST
jgi:hypothetical protein